MNVLEVLFLVWVACTLSGVVYTLNDTGDDLTVVVFLSSLSMTMFLESFCIAFICTAPKFIQEGKITMSLGITMVAIAILGIIGFALLLVLTMKFLNDMLLADALLSHEIWWSGYEVIGYNTYYGIITADNEEITEMLLKCSSNDEEWE